MRKSFFIGYEGIEHWTYERGWLISSVLVSISIYILYLYNVRRPKYLNIKKKY